MRGDVQRRGRLVSDQQCRVAGQRHGDHHALAHAARKLEGVAVYGLCRVGYFNLPQQLDATRARFGFGHVAMQSQDFGDLVAHGVHRRQRRHGLLKDHGNRRAAHLADLLAARMQLGQVDGCTAGRIEQHGAAHDAAGFVNDLQDRACGDTLAAAAFADHAEGLAMLDIERDVVHRLDGAVAHGKVRAQVAYRQQCRGRRRAGGGGGGVR